MLTLAYVKIANHDVNYCVNILACNLLHDDYVVSYFYLWNDSLVGAIYACYACLCKSSKS